MKEKEKKKSRGADASDAEKEQTASDVTEEAESEDTGIDRESMTDEEYIACIEEKLGQCMAETITCRNLTRRIQADFDNYRKRTACQSEEMKNLGISLVVEKMLGVLDNCDLARKYIQDESALTGFNMMETQILSALSGFGLEEIDALNKDFDVKLMNAVEREKSEDSDGKVLEVQSKGYLLKGKLLRPANVKVSYKEKQE